MQQEYSLHHSRPGGSRRRREQLKALAGSDPSATETAARQKVNDACTAAQSAQNASDEPALYNSLLEENDPQA